MTLEAWVNPSTVNANWRDVIYKGNDNYYLEATSTNASRPDAGMIAGGSYADAFGTAALTANTWSYLTETYDGVDAAAVRQRHPGRLDGAHGHDRDLHQPAADRRRQHLRPVLRRPDRRGPRLQRRADRRPDPDRHDDAGEQRPGHDPADAAGDADRDRGQCQRGRPVLGRLDRQRRGDRLPGRALLGRRLHQLRPDRHHHRHRDHLQGHQHGRLAPPTATASAPPTPPATSAPTRTPPAPPRPHRTRPRRRSRGR